MLVPFFVCETSDRAATPGVGAAASIMKVGYFLSVDQECLILHKCVASSLPRPN